MCLHTLQLNTCGLIYDSVFKHKNGKVTQFFIFYLIFCFQMKINQIILYKIKTEIWKKNLLKWNKPEDLSILDTV